MSTFNLVGSEGMPNAARSTTLPFRFGDNTNKSPLIDHPETHLTKYGTINVSINFHVYGIGFYDSFRCGNAF